MRYFVMMLLAALYAWGDLIPQWYAEESYRSGGAQYYGYGHDADRQKAVAIAKQNIAQAIQSVIKSEISSDTKVKDGKVSKAARQRLQATTDVVLADTQTVKVEEVAGIWYAVIGYEHLAIEEKVRRALGDVQCTQSPNAYLQKTPLMAQIDAKLPCAPKFDLWRSNSLWYIKHGSFATLLNNDNFDKLFASVDGETLHIASTHDNKRLYENEAFAFEITAQKRGYLSLLAVYEDGKVGVMFANHPVKTGMTLTFPQANADFEMVAGLVTPNVQTKDLYVALLSDERIDTSRFEIVNDELIVGDDAYKFAEVIELMQTYPFATKLMRTYPRTY